MNSCAACPGLYPCSPPPPPPPPPSPCQVAASAALWPEPRGSSQGLRQTSLTFPRACTVLGRVYAYGAVGFAAVDANATMYVTAPWGSGLLVVSPSLMPQKLVSPPAGHYFASSPAVVFWASPPLVAAVAVNVNSSTTTLLLIIPPTSTFTPVPLSTLAPGLAAAPIVLVPSADLVVVAVGTAVHAVAVAKQAVVWTVDVADFLTPALATVAAIAVDTDGVTVVASCAGGAVAVTVASGLVRWKLAAANHTNTDVLVVKTDVVLANDAGVYVVDGAAGTVRGVVAPLTHCVRLAVSNNCTLVCVAAMLNGTAELAAVAVGPPGTALWTLGLGVAQDAVRDVVVDAAGNVAVLTVGATGLVVTVVSSAGRAVWASTAGTVEGTDGSLAVGPAGSIVVLASGSAFGNYIYELGLYARKVCAYSVWHYLYL